MAGHGQPPSKDRRAICLGEIEGSGQALSLIHAALPPNALASGLAQDRCRTIDAYYHK
jgi:hypothetical protein